MAALIAQRLSQFEEFSNLVPLKIGMCLATRVDEDRDIIMTDNALPYPHFIYVVGDIKDDKVLLIDTAHNNQWEIKVTDLNSCELADEFHHQYEDVDCAYINRALNGFYKYGN